MDGVPLIYGRQSYQTNTSILTNVVSPITSQVLQSPSVGTITKVSGTNTRPLFSRYEEGFSSHAINNAQAANLEVSGTNARPLFSRYEEGSSSRASNNAKSTNLEGTNTRTFEQQRRTNVYA